MGSEDLILTLQSSQLIVQGLAVVVPQLKIDKQRLLSQQRAGILHYLHAFHVNIQVFNPFFHEVEFREIFVVVGEKTPVILGFRLVVALRSPAKILTAICQKSWATVHFARTPYSCDGEPLNEGNAHFSVVFHVPIRGKACWVT